MSEEPPTETPGAPTEPNEPEVTEPNEPEAAEARGGFRLDDATALARAARDLLRAGLHVQARPLVEELASMLETARATAGGAKVVDLATERTKRRT